jgi:hypothetical protein
LLAGFWPLLFDVSGLPWSWRCLSYLPARILRLRILVRVVALLAHVDVSSSGAMA